MGDFVTNSNRTLSPLGGIQGFAETTAAILDLRYAILPLTSISSTPEFAGQFSIVAGDAYIAVGTSSSADWKKIT